MVLAYKMKLLPSLKFHCMQDTFARARTWPKCSHSAARPSAGATIGYRVYKKFQSLDKIQIMCDKGPYVHIFNETQNFQ